MSKLQGNLFDIKKTSSIAFAASSVAMAGSSGKNDGSYSETRQQMKEDEEENSKDYKLNTLDEAQVCEQKLFQSSLRYQQSSAGGRFWPPRPHRDLRQTPP